MCEVLNLLHHTLENIPLSHVTKQITLSILLLLLRTTVFKVAYAYIFT